MKEDWVQGAPLHLHTQLHMHFVPHTMAAGKDCPLQSSFRAVYCYLSLWFGVQNTPVGQRVNTEGRLKENVIKRRELKGMCRNEEKIKMKSVYRKEV